MTKEFAYTTGALSNPVSTVTNVYGSTVWGDLLTKHGDTTITYDTIGNTLNDGTWTYTWERGRQLKSMSNGSTTWNMTYDADGLRTKRTDGINTYLYYYDGGLLRCVEYNGVKMFFTYDAQGMPVSMTYNGATYYYALNLQGDVMAILNASSAAVVNYNYNAWGELLSTTGSLANTIGLYNPLRYRGYVYDRETGLYYISSRYYNPEICRWINADSVLPSAGGSPIGYNMFAYCFNNPVMHYDPTGNFPLLILAAAVLLFTPVGGIAAQAVTSAVCYAGMAVASVWDEEIREDMDAIGWNPFNCDEEATVSANKVSFYKGAPVFLKDAGRSGSFCAISLNRNGDEDTLKHERGHNSQVMMMGVANFGLMIGLPSAFEWSTRSYYDRPWEITADLFGGVTSRSHTKEDINRGYWYLGISSLGGPLGYIFLFDEY